MCNVSRRKCQINYELTIKEKVKEIILAIWLVLSLTDTATRFKLFIIILNVTRNLSYSESESQRDVGMSCGIPHFKFGKHRERESESKKQQQLFSLTNKPFPKKP